jgi:hypothetical protein
MKNAYKNVDGKPEGRPLGDGGTEGRTVLN